MTSSELPPSTDTVLFTDLVGFTEYNDAVGDAAAVEALDAHRILHDASHLSRAAFDDLLALSPRTVIASHSNAQALLRESERHLTDAQIAAIRDRGGWIGLNLYGRFLAHERRATLDDCVAQTMHVARGEPPTVVSALAWMTLRSVPGWQPVA